MMEEEKQQAKEPEIGYLKKTITFFSSIEEENEETAKTNAQLSPQENLTIVCNIIRQLYSDKLANLQNPYTQITFVSYEYLH